MNRPLLTCVFVVLASAALHAQQPAPPDPNQGQANPPADDTIVASPDQVKPQAGTPMVPPPAAQPEAPQAAPQAAPGSQPTSVDQNANFPDPNRTVSGDNGTVQIAPSGDSSADPRLTARAWAGDPDGDIVHPQPLPPGTLGEGATIRVHLLTPLSTTESQRGETFRTQVASDVLQDGQVLIPAGAEIDGQVIAVSTGTLGGHGSLRLRPDTVILADGTRYHLDAQVTGTPGAHTRVSGEGTINAGSRYRKDSIEYGGAVGAGVVAGAVIGGPVGALTGGLIGAGAVTVHLLVSHPQATLEPGTVLLFTLNDRLNLQAAAPPAGN